MTGGRSVLHDRPSMLKQRLFALACGYEDQNDHDQLCDDLGGSWRCEGAPS